MSCPYIFPLPSSPSLAQFIPSHRRCLMAAFTGEIMRVAFERLAMAATGTHGVGEREVPAEPLELARLTPHQAPPFGWMIANLEEAPVHGNIAAIDVQHDDLARGDAYDGVPGAAAQQVCAPFSDARPAPGLQFCGTNGTRGIRHAYILRGDLSRGRDRGHNSVQPHSE